MAKIKITLTKSPIGYNKKQRATAVALGLKKMNSSVIQENTPDIMGKIASIAHLVTWEQVIDAEQN
ncbi:MAG: 50S ribosomal protein L30 [Clostridiales bacterium]